MGKIRILENSVALKIAAGEVIDRPSSVLRELLDNSIDAGSTEISVYIESSGMKEIRVTDNGSGMDGEDLKLSVLQHATSKIETAEDIYSIKTLGFRGEALSSIASSSRLEIITNTVADEIGYSLKTEPGGNIEVTPVRARKGTTVSVKELFYAFPARKKFLKSPSAETALCKNVFYEKAVARPEIAFRLYIDDTLIQMLPASGLKERVLLSYNTVFQDSSFAYDVFDTDECDNKYKITGVLSDPALFRKDRKYIHIYLNGRRIQEYSLIQAIVYGYSGFLPGGHFPSAVLLIEDSPELVDFNIHPAKKEARIKNLNHIHHSVTESVRKTLEKKSSSVSFPSVVVLNTDAEFKSAHDNNNELFVDIIPFQNSKNISGKSFSSFNKSFMGNSGNYLESDAIDPIIVAEKQPLLDRHNAESGPFSNFRYLGQLFNIFLLCEKDECLYIIDQHASHERTIYESLYRKKTVTQKLLVPLYLPDDLDFTGTMIEKYRDTGISIEKDDSGSYFIDALPDILSCIKSDIVAIISESPGNIEEVRKKLFATASCKAAVKGGDMLSDMEACAIIDSAFRLDSPYCPHGRPVWKKISKKELLEDINRII